MKRLILTALALSLAAPAHADTLVDNVNGITLDKDGNPCALIPLGYFEDDTIREVAKMMYQ